MTDLTLLIAVIGFFVWFIIGWMVVVFNRGMVNTISMVMHNVPWLGWTLFVFTILLWPIAALVVTVIASLAQKILDLTNR